MRPLDLSNVVCQTVAVASRDWARLARYARERRDELGLTQEEVAARGGPSTATLRIIENLDRDNASQSSFRPKSLRQLEDGLGWERGSALTIIAGGEPAARDSHSAGAARRYSDPGLQAIWELPLPEEERLLAIAAVQQLRKARERDATPPRRSNGDPVLRR